MAKPLSFASLNATTGKPTVDPRYEAASRCLTLLVTASRAGIALDAAFKAKDKAAGERALDSLVEITWVYSKNGLAQDIQALAAMLGCTIVEADATGKVDA